MSGVETTRIASQPYCWVRDGEDRRLTFRQARAVAESDHCSETAYIHPVGEPETKLTTRSDVEAHSRAITNGSEQE